MTKSDFVFAKAATLCVTPAATLSTGYLVYYATGGDALASGLVVLCIGLPIHFFVFVCTAMLSAYLTR